MANMTRVNQMALANALGGDTAVADALGNALNGSAMNGYTPIASSGIATGVWAGIGTLMYVEITLILSAGGKPTVTLPFTHQGLSNQFAVLAGSSAGGVSITGIVGPESAVVTLSKYDGSALAADTYFLSGTYQSSVG